jgi:uncharacterized protein DUF4113
VQLGIAAPSALLVGGGYSITGAAYRDHSTRPFHRYKKAGVTFLDPLLLDQPDDVPSLRRMRAIEQLNARFSRGTIGFGTAGERQAWSLRREFPSPRFTTDRNELLRL